MRVTSAITGRGELVRRVDGQQVKADEILPAMLSSDEPGVLCFLH